MDIKNLMAGGIFGNKMGDIVNDPRKVQEFAVGQSVLDDFGRNYNRALDLQQLGIRAPRGVDTGAGAGALAGYDMTQNIEDKKARQSQMVDNQADRKKWLEGLFANIQKIGLV